MILIETNGERQLVTSLDGYPGATVINPDVPEQPSDFHFLDEAGNWQHDEQLEHDRLTAAAMADKDAMIAELQARLAEVEAFQMVATPMIEQASGISLSTGDPIAE